MCISTYITESGYYDIVARKGDKSLGQSEVKLAGDC
jgi:hypothetical protein